MSEQRQDNGAQSSFGMWLALGVGIGVAMGAAFDNIAMGLSLGIAIGVAIGLGQRSRPGGGADDESAE